METDNESNARVDEHENVSEVLVEAVVDSESNRENKAPEKARLVKLPLQRVRSMMRTDPECNLISQDALLVMTKATELFIASLSEAVYACIAKSKKKTIQKQDFVHVVNTASNLCFMDGMLDN